jgi:hypothetical protein
LWLQLLANLNKLFFPMQLQQQAAEAAAVAAKHTALLSEHEVFL